ncbi:MAG: hypothetical protein ACON5F_02580 [Jejuia sp.]
MDDKAKLLNFSVDTITKKISITGDQNKNITILKYTYSTPDLMELKGNIENDSVLITLKKKDQFLLKSRGFHWINESPFNR